MNLQIEYIKKEDLKPYVNNAKIHTDEQVEQIRRSIEQFGFNDPIAIWHDNEVIEGHGRLLAIMEMDDIDKVPVIRLDNLTDQQRKAYAIVHNSLVLQTGFDMQLLQEELQAIGTIDMTQYDFSVRVDTPQDVLQDCLTDEPKKQREPENKTVGCPCCGREVNLKDLG